MKARIVVASGVAMLLSMACGGSSSGGGGGGPTLAITPKPAPAVTAGGSGNGFTATLTGATDTINWTLTPSTGRGSISPATGVNTTYTPPASVASATTVTLTATAGTLTDSVTITINPPATITVTGKVVASNGLPVANSPVVIGTQSAITAADGTFTISNVTTPYDLISVVSTPNKLGVVYKGLTRTDPTILQMGLVPALPYSGTVGGSVSPVPANKTYVAWGSPETTKTSGNLAANPYSLSLTWLGATSTTGTLHALQWHPASGLPTGYDGYGTKTGVTVANSGTTSGQNITMTGVSSDNISGSITLPASYTLGSKAMSVVFSSGASIPILSDSTSTTSFNYLTPSSVGGTITLTALAGASGVGLSVAGKTGLAANATGVTVAPQEVSVHGLPANAGTGITTNTDFTWTQFAGGLHIVVLAPTVATNPAFYVFTTGTTTKIPDLSAQGLGLPSGGASYGWTIVAVAPWTSIDDFAGGFEMVPSGTSYYESLSTSRSFTTQ
jgi:hypothetical protein